MFNGIIFNTGKIKTIKKYNKTILIGIKTKSRFSSKDLGSSISCNGVCLTLTRMKAGLIFFYISNETIKRSNFNNIDVGHLVNLEKSLTYGQKISGHFIQGHVDTTAVVKKIDIIDKTWLLKLQIRNNKFKIFRRKGFNFNQWCFLNNFKDIKKQSIFKHNSTHFKINQS